MRLLIPLFSPATGTWGGLTRVTAIARAATDAGHEVALCASGSLATDLRRQGFQVYATPPPTMLGLPASISRRLEKRSQRLSLPVPPGRSVGSIWLVMMFSGMAHAGYLRRLVRAQLQAVQEFAPDRIFTDIDPAAGLTAAIAGVPFAATYAGILTEGHGSLPWKAMSRAMNAVLREHRRPATTPDESCSGAHVLKIIPSIPELDGTDAEGPDVRYVGHLLGDIRTTATDFSPEAGRRYVFCYVGTGSLSLDRMRQVLPRVFPVDGEHTCLVGVQGITWTERIGAVQFSPYVPAEAVLPHCDWTICHGGQNTIAQSLRRDVPLIAFPGAIFERRFNARKVQDAGAGLMGESDQFTEEWLRAALARQAECAAEAARLGARIRSYGGAAAAVAAIEAWRPARG
ncbi:MAG: glycosyltransferase [Anaerolineae bacterium]